VTPSCRGAEGFGGKAVEDKELVDVSVVVLLVLLVVVVGALSVVVVLFVVVVLPLVEVKRPLPPWGIPPLSASAAPANGASSPTTNKAAMSGSCAASLCLSMHPS
jgi:hypothetical protein